MNVDEGQYDFYKSDGVITMKIEKFSEFAQEGKDANRLSEPIYVRGLEWKILALVTETRIRDANESNWACSVSAELKVLAQKRGTEDHVREIKHRFHAKESAACGFAQLSFEGLLHPLNGFYDVSTDSIILKTKINADIPVGIEMRSQMCEELGNLFDKGDKYSDCTLVSSDGIKFKAHKCILASRSSVFAAMFEHEMVEAQKGIANIADIRSEVLEQMLRFIYNGIEPNMENIAEDLLIAAEEYGLVNLKIICERKLVDSLDNENACRLLVVASQHTSKFLKASAIKHIAENAYEVTQTEGWKMLIQGNYGELFDQIFKAVIPKKD